MIKFEIDQTSQERLESFLSSLPPRLMAGIHQSLKTLLYQQVQSGIQKYFAGSGPKGGPTSALLTSRSGALTQSLFDSIESGIDPSSPGAGTTEITVRLGSALPYARIQEYGGFAGRPGPFRKTNGRRPYLPPRPYLQPVFDDLQAALPDALQQAVNAVINSS